MSEINKLVTELNEISVVFETVLKRLLETVMNESYAAGMSDAKELADEAMEEAVYAAKEEGFRQGYHEGYDTGARVYSDESQW